ncbi:hypothetical protein [Kitasatospora sp. NPDC057015]
MTVAGPTVTATPAAVGGAATGPAGGLERHALPGDPLTWADS